MIAKFSLKASITPTIKKNKWNYSVDWVKLLNGLSKIPTTLATADLHGPAGVVLMGDS